MKFNTIFICLVLIFFFSCRDNEAIINSDTQLNNNQGAILLKMATLGFGITMLDGQQNVIKYFGPNNYGGYKAIGLFAPGWSGLDDIADLKAAKNSGYFPIYASINRPDLVTAGKTNNWSVVIGQVQNAVANGADWINVDDAQCGNYDNNGNIDNNKLISVSTMIQFCDNVHKNNSLRGSMVLVSCAEHGGVFWAKTSSADLIPGFHQKIDIIMPYGYNDGTTQNLGSFFSRLKSECPAQNFVPFLGWHVCDPPNSGNGTWYSQKGAKSNDEAFIELAKSYSTMNLVFYYFEPDNDNWSLPWNSTGLGKNGMGYYLDQLTNYLQDYSYIVTIY